MPVEQRGDPEKELPAKQEQFVELNAQLAKEWLVIEDKKDPLPDADQRAEVTDKLEYLER